MWDLEAGIGGVDGAGEGYLGPVLDHSFVSFYFLTVYL